VHLAVFGELERVGEQILEDLAKALRVGDDLFGTIGCDVDRVAEVFPAATCSNSRRRVVRSSGTDRSVISTVTVPDSTLARSRMLLRSPSRSLPEVRMTLAYSTCVSVMFLSGFSSSCWARINRLFSGVRSSCDMFAMNSDLYFDETAVWAS
jgi:hypothetical protein